MTEPMKPAQFRACLKLLEMSQTSAARFFGVAGRSVRRWASDPQYPAPKFVANVLVFMVTNGVKPQQIDPTFEP